MAKPVKSQWDFGELFSGEPTHKVLSVTELTWQIKRLLEGQVGAVWVTGEITNLRFQSSGHIYFTLKDTGAQLSCVLFRGESKVDRSLLHDGRKVTLQGEVTVYEPRGQYQLRVTVVEMQGIGALQLAFEKLKQKLNAEGLFAQERKRRLPQYPQRLGLVTSPTGAAIRDVLHVVARRHPRLEIILAPCRVQGEGAAEEVATAIRRLNQFHCLAAVADPPTPIDLILVTRGGGSLEDLWTFNEEAVARAIFESRLPVVSAVGHEIDFTISDFVADLRAATPSAAAEIITEGIVASGQFLAEVDGRLRQLLRQHLGDKQDQFTQVRQRLARVHPRRRVQDWLQRLDDAQAGLLRAANHGTHRQRLIWQTLTERLTRVRPSIVIKQRRDLVQQAEHRFREQAHQRMRQSRHRLAAAEARLRLLGPEQVLARGYSITLAADTGAVLRDPKSVKPGQRLRTHLHAGELHSRVED